MNSSELLELGFEKAGKKLQGKEELKRKLAIAFEFHRVVTPGIITRFQEALKLKTAKIHVVCPSCNGKPEKPKKEHKNSNGKCGYCKETGAQRMTHDKLAFCKIAEYGEVPPAEVLGKVKEAKERNCFDYFEVAKVETVEVRPDPIIFGRINGIDDRFFVAQWDKDVSIDDILMENEG